MITRRGAVLLLALALTACSTAVDGTGRGASTAQTSSGPVPCGSSAPSQAPGCTPPTTASSSSSSMPAPTTTAPTTSSIALPSTWEKFRRTVFRTPFGDPALLNVCKVADSTDISKFGMTLVAPSSTLAASCTLDFNGAKVTDHQTVVMSVLRTGPDTTPTPKQTKVYGQTVYAYPYQSGGACVRSLVVVAGGVTTTVTARIYGELPGGSTTSCGVSDALIAPFASIAAGTSPPPTVPTTAPSLFSLEACKVAISAGISSSPLATGDATDSDYDTSCGWTKSNVLFLSTGLLRNPSANPDGKAVSIGGHTLYDVADVKGTCNYVSKQAGGETIEVYYSQSKAASASRCKQAGALLGKYLDVLGLH